MQKAAKNEWKSPIIVPFVCFCEVEPLFFRMNNSKEGMDEIHQT